jgi:2,3-bisphosphoglycerate-independent phosphoglycerate mutase
VEGEGLKIPGYGTEVALRTDGRLSDVAPTILEILKLPQPPEMTGKSMVIPVEFQVRANRTPVRLSL